MGLVAALRSWLARRTPPPPGQLAACVEQGIAHYEEGRFDKAERLWRSVLAAAPDHAEAHHLIGLIHLQRGESMAALREINAAIALAPGEAQFHFNLGNALTALGEHEAAADALGQAVRLRPAHPQAWFNLGKARMETRDWDAAVNALEQSFALQPELPGLRSDLCIALIAQGDRQPSQPAPYLRAAGLLEDHWQAQTEPHAARLMLAYCLQQARRLVAAERHYAGVLASNPTWADALKAHSNIGNCYNQMGRMAEALEHYRAALALDPTLPDTASSIAAVTNYLPEAGPAQVLETHRDWGRRFAAQLPRRAHLAIDRDPQRPLRVGLVSPDLRRHPVAALCMGMLEHLDRSALEVHAYYNFPTEDVITQRIRRACAGWRAIHALDDEAVADLIRSDRIDVLVDLAGHTTNNRLGLFARKPAPLQVSWLGYFCSTGLDTFDAFLSDPWSSPPGQERWFAEPLLRLPHTRFCYLPWEGMPGVNGLPALGNRDIRLGCFNNLGKLNDSVLALWAQVLAAIPQATLVLQAQALDDPDNADLFRARAGRAGIPAGHLELRPFAPYSATGQSYHDIDIALDPFPFCGGMTSFDALWMGVPVVTLEQPLIAGRQTLSMLHNIGLERLVARDAGDYVRIAARLAADREALAELRRTLRGRFSASPLADHARFARDWTDTLRTLWQAQAC